MLHIYVIEVDGHPYGGESEQVLEQRPGFHATGWGHSTPKTRNGIELGGDHHKITGRRNLRAHVLRILEQCEGASEVLIRRVQ